ncbi:hypothetical protein AV530_003831 [Patagioenas fasciata monilis]|uniref:Uncharacterized protein n=1 Tax=Patagioenas fasciata monilis TaxID=372326 RepID=A0A1V4KZR5_PATFA|nr:hypothetical protein AV530_003831 [Patagioenas fasciata monilis]
MQKSTGNCSAPDETAIVPWGRHKNPKAKICSPLGFLFVKIFLLYYISSTAEIQQKIFRCPSVYKPLQCNSQHYRSTLLHLELVSYFEKNWTTNTSFLMYLIIKRLIMIPTVHRNSVQIKHVNLQQ